VGNQTDSQFSANLVSFVLWSHAHGMSGLLWVFATGDVTGCRELCVAFVLQLGTGVRENFRQRQRFIIFQQQNLRKVTHIRVLLVST